MITPLEMLGPDDLITMSQAGRLLGVSLPTVRRWIETGQLQGTITGAGFMFKRAYIEDQATRLPKGHPSKRRLVPLPVKLAG